MAVAASRLTRFAPAAVVVVLAAVIVWGFAAQTLYTTARFELPLDVSYSSLVEARDLMRGTLPSTSPSLLWPALIAPFWAVGARGLVWIAFGFSALVYVVTGLGIYRVVRMIGGGSERLAGMAAAVAALVLPPFAFNALAGTGQFVAVVLVLGLLLSTRPWMRIVLGVATLLAWPPWVWAVQVPVGVVAWIVCALAVVGAVRIALWARGERQWVVASVAIVAPIVWMPLVFVPAGVALLPLGEGQGVRRPWRIVAVVLALVAIGVGYRAQRVDMRRYAYASRDVSTRTGAIGDYVRAKLPEARILTEHGGALAFYADVPVTDEPAAIGAAGPGTRFELLESLPVERRPSHVAYDRGVVTPFTGRLVTNKGRLQLSEAIWDHAHSAERPVNDHTGWSVVDRVDIADLASERAHRWRGAHDSVLERSQVSGLAIDGGRTITTSEQFTVEVVAAKPTRLVLRTGGQRGYPGQPTLTTPVELTIFSRKKKLGTLTVTPPSGPFAEVTFNLPPFATPTGTLEIRTTSTGPYRVFHWFVLQ
jgi:hypothetical protein